MLVAIVCLALVVLLLGALLRLAVAHQRQVQYEQMRLQADWLAEAGVQRAVYRVEEDQAYTGETWHVSAEDLGGAEGGEVAILVSALAEDPGVRQVRVTARYPVATYRFASRTKQILVQVAAPP